MKFSKKSKEIKDKKLRKKTSVFGNNNKFLGWFFFFSFSNGIEK